MDITTPSSAGLPSHKGNYNTLDTPPGLPSPQKGTTTPWIPHQVFLHHRRELQHPGYPTRSSFTTEEK
ncbi:hypothetical protein Taro_053805 [Colocasia esculenta]|uniref:Uncharacterized protein n=1 Tax=Colocasia esculenta TaxID=4460 RepID=A0A843XPA9_COLES|nr:hypothetical protein [Colocasia esculenta]